MPGGRRISIGRGFYLITRKVPFPLLPPIGCKRPRSRLVRVCRCHVFAHMGEVPHQNVKRAPSQRTRLPESLPKKPCPGGERVLVISPKFEAPTVAFGLLK